MSKASVNKELLRNSILSFGTAAIRGLKAVCVSLIIARGFTPDLFGDFRFFQLSAILLTAIAAPGIVAVSTKFFANLQGNTISKQPIAHLWMLSILLAGVVSIACFALPVPSVGNNEYSSSLLFAAIVFVGAANFLPMGAMMGMSLFRQLFVMEFFSFCILIAAAFFASWAQNIMMIIWGMFAVGAMSLLLNSTIVIWFVGLEIIQKSRTAFDTAIALKKVSGTLGPMALVGIFGAATFWVVGWTTYRFNYAPIFFALYSIGMQWFVLADMVPDRAGCVIFPKTVQLPVDNRNERLRLLKLSALAAFASSSLVAIGAFIISPFVMPFYGQQYVSSSYLLGTYAAAAIPYGITNMVSYALLANDGELDIVLVSLVQLLVAALVAFATLPLEEFTGALALFISSVAGLTTATYFAYRRGLFAPQVSSTA